MAEAAQQQSQVASKAQTAVEHLTAATTAIQQDNIQKANKELDSATGTLRTLYDKAPGSGLVSGMDTATTAGDLAPIVAQVRQEAVYMDPQVVAGTEQAQERMKSGDKEAASEKLRLARQTLVADVALLPVEDAYARVMAAQAELQQGHKDRALRLLQNVPITIEQVSVAAPMVPVRFNLRAAAAAVEAGKWKTAQQLVGEAANTLQRIKQNVTDSSVAQEIQPLASKVQDMEKRMDSNNKPKPQELVQLAQQTRNVFQQQQTQTQQ